MEEEPDHKPQPEKRRVKWKEAMRWVILAALVWEALGRPLVTMLFPGLELPESALKDILGLCISLLGGG